MLQRFSPTRVTTSRKFRIALLVGALLAGMGSALAADAPLDPAQLLERQQAGQAPLLLDVRRSDEYADGHIAGALNIPVEQLASRAGVLGAPHDSEIVVYCVSGKRAAKAQQTLTSLGYTHVRVLDGSLNAWRQRQLPLAH
ncbi:rhodanese-like domain-containing protein [Dyella telluris]|uniref:Rhodanese-like domain-containing protein n=1 Tax=Dyella telluris TaxID=2763498 RepID=A0A7G8Q7M7_9GAMM|nr:rhodanese-like domain-containing protein [Dyella telluris]QNK02785.1 rhodanese-like domain-containing protein [Dyella telluris]